MGVCNCSMFCCTLLYVHSSIAIILMGKRELVDLLYLSSWCLAVVGRLFLAVPQGCLRFVIVVFPDHTHLLFLKMAQTSARCIPHSLLEDDCAHNHASYNCKLSDVLSNLNDVRRWARPIASKMSARF